MVTVEGSASFKRIITRALLNLKQCDLVAKRIIERSRTYNVATANEKTGVIAINLHELTARQKRDLDLVASIIVHEDHHLRQGPVNDENRVRIERAAYRKQVRYLEAVGNRKLACHIRTVGRDNIMEEARITYI